MLVFIKLICNKVYKIEVEETDSIQSLKSKLFEQDHYLSQKNIKFLFNNKYLEDVKELRHYNIKNETTIFVVEPIISMI